MASLLHISANFASSLEQNKNHKVTKSNPTTYLLNKKFIKLRAE
jgi:hypothetical protein